MLKLKPKALRGVLFTVESNGKEVNIDSLLPRGFKTRLIEKLLEELSVQIGTDDPKEFVRSLFYFVYRDEVSKHREKENEMIEFLKWRIGISKRTEESSPQVRKEPDRERELQNDEKTTKFKKKISFSDVLPYAYRGDNK